MKISGFSFARNATKLYYPIKQSVESILPIVDEFVIALGAGDEDDRTRNELLSINSSKIKIIDTVWNPVYMKRNAILAVETDLAKSHCSGDWLFYIQADEVVHEKYLDAIHKRCSDLLDKNNIEGLLFSYKHFWGDYDHYQNSHGWYPYEIRIIRNNPNIHSWKDAQSFRYYDYYDNPHQIEGTRKLNVALANAEIYHYGWVRPPELMQAKSFAIDSTHKGIEKTKQKYSALPKYFDYGPLNRLTVFKDTHPKVMYPIVNNISWKHQLQYSGKPNKNRLPHRHELFKYRIVSIIEKTLFNGKQLFTFNNYQLIKNL